jgi:hypothetical protein
MNLWRSRRDEPLSVVPKKFDPRPSGPEPLVHSPSMEETVNTIIRRSLVRSIACLSLITAAGTLHTPANAALRGFGGGIGGGRSIAHPGYVPLGPNTAGFRNACSHGARCVYVPQGWPNNRMVPAKPPPASLLLPSDERLKRDVVLVDRSNGIPLYRFKYIWSDQLYVGVMAQEVASIVPDAVLRGSDGYLRVNYARLGLRLQSWDEWRAMKRTVCNPIDLLGSAWPLAARAQQAPLVGC